MYAEHNTSATVLKNPHRDKPKAFSSTDRMTAMVLSEQETRWSILQPYAHLSHA